jgi:hypothetical protein
MTATFDLPATDPSAPFDVELDAGELIWRELLIKLPRTAAAPGTGS